MEWISVDEALPEDGEYLCSGHGGKPFICLLRTERYGSGRVWLRSSASKRVFGITHYMPLPAPPKKDCD